VLLTNFVNSLEHLAMMQVVLGKLPAGMVRKATGSAQGLFVNGDLNYPNPMVDRKSRKFVKKMKPLRVSLAFRMPITVSPLTLCM
jgi:dual-specificity kinase